RAPGFTIELRINMETLAADGSVRPSAGTITAFELPTGPGIRVDTHGHVGFRPSAGFDSLLAKIVVTVGAPDFSVLLAKAERALAELRVDGVATNAALLARLLRHPALRGYEVTTRFIDEH